VTENNKVDKMAKIDRESKMIPIDENLLRLRPQQPIRGNIHKATAYMDDLTGDVYIYPVAWGEFEVIWEGFGYVYRDGLPYFRIKDLRGYAIRQDQPDLVCFLDRAETVLRDRFAEYRL